MGLRIGYGLLLHCRAINLQGDLVADEDSAGLNRGVVFNAEVGAINRGSSLEPNAGLAPRVLGRAKDVDIQGDRLGNAVDSQISGNGGLFLALELNGSGRECFSDTMAACRSRRRKYLPWRIPELVVRRWWTGRRWRLAYQLEPREKWL